MRRRFGTSVRRTARPFGARPRSRTRRGHPAYGCLSFLCLFFLLTVLTPAWAVAQTETAPSPIIVLVAYHSGTGHTEQLAKSVAAGAESVPGTKATLRRVERVTAEELFGADALVLGSPVYWSNMAGAVKTFIDNWQFKFGVWPELKLKDKVGAAFATGGQVAGGKELTMLSILAAMLHNQMIVVSGGGAFGASATTEGDSPGIDEQERAAAQALGRRVAEVAAMVRQHPKSPVLTQ